MLRQQIVDVARQEWERWGKGSKLETEQAMRDALRAYWENLGASRAEADKRISRRWAWSAAFISWVMARAGAGTAFRKSGYHYVYLAEAKRNRANRNRSKPFWAYRITEVAPVAGDLVCKARPPKPKAACSAVTYDNVDDTTDWPTHCDIVTSVQAKSITVIGGNVSDSVGQKRIDTDSRGFLPERARDGCRFIAVIKVGDSGSAPAPAPPSSLSSETGSAAAADRPTGPFGKLIFQATGKTPYEYALTPDDVLWAARFIKGEAGGKDDADSRAVMWAMFNRYAIYAHKIWPTLAEFLRAYSTPLQPHLVNPAAVERSIRYSKENPRKFTWVQWGTFPYTGKVRKYQGQQIPKGQLQHHLDLQRTRWGDLPATVRSLAERLLKGAVPNPVGLASEFANTLTFLRQDIRKAGRDPQSITPQEWQDYTRDYARRQKRVWIGERSGLDQMHKNAFFIDVRSTGLPADAVRIVRP